MSQRILPVNVVILDKEYLVACPRGQETALLASARRVDEEMRSIRDSGKVLGMDRIAVIVALNLAHELLLSQLGYAENKDSQSNSSQIISIAESEAIARLQEMQEKIETTLVALKSSSLP